MSGRQMASAYLTDHGMRAEIPQDSFRTGDLGCMDADGYLYITGRKKDVIIRGGVNIVPMEISSVLLWHPAVVEAATIGVPDDIYGEGIVSFVAARAGHTVSPDELIAYCRTRLSDFKLPQQVFVLEAIPKNDRGKVARESLQALWRTYQRVPQAHASTAGRAPSPERGVSHDRWRLGADEHRH